MTENDFRQLLARAEGEILDFKVEGYQLPAARNDFIKDVLSMANTPRDKPALIVFGVRWTAESGSTVEGLASQLDDAVLQDAFGHGRVQPNPRYLYTPFTFEGKQVGVLEVPVERGGPYTPIKDFEGLQAGAVYYRRGTQNDRAVGPELRRVFEWFLGADPGVSAEDARDSWTRFLEAAHRFETGTSYILAADRLPSTSTASLQALGLPPWRAVIDFDPDSDATGLLSSVAGSLGHRRVVHRVVRGEYRVQPEPGTHWFFARGLAGRQETLVCGNHTSWLKSYKQELAGQLERLAAAVSPSPVVAILLWSDVGLRRHLTTLIEELHGAFGEAVEVVVVSADGPSFEAIAEEAGATFVQNELAQPL